MAKNTDDIYIDFITDCFKEDFLTIVNPSQTSTFSVTALEPSSLFSVSDIDWEPLNNNSYEPPIPLDTTERAGDASQCDLEDAMHVEVTSKKRSAYQASLEPRNSIKDKRTAKKPCIEKPEMLRFFESVIEVDLDKYVLTDIVYMQDGSGEFTVVGRPKVEGSSTKQMCHVTPFSFIEKLITHMVKNSASTSDLFSKLSNTILILLDNKTGFCFNNQDLENSPYKKISSALKKKPEMVNKSLFNADNEYLFVNSSCSKALFSTPTKKAAAIKEFSIRNKEFIQASLIKLKRAIGDEEGNTLTIASEALARYMFILFNQQKYTAFPKEGNTLGYEIRLYKTPEEAESPKNKGYKVMTSKEIKDLYFDVKKTSEINKCIRIVNWEGAKTKEIYKGLVSLDKIIKEHNLFSGLSEIDSIEELLEIFNISYNFQLKLSNTDPVLKKYNEDLYLDTYQESLAYQTAKLLYIIFDFKALEDNVFVPDIDKENSIHVYNSATGKKLCTYSVQDGETYRKIQKNGATGYNDKVTFRTAKADPVILAQKAVDHFYISLLPFGGFYEGFINTSPLQSLEESKGNGIFKIILNSFANLICLDYRFSQKQVTAFESLINTNYDKIIALQDSLATDQNYDIKITGENFDFLNVQ